jgi:hypothetical protein
MLIGLFLTASHVIDVCMKFADISTVTMYVNDEVLIRQFLCPFFGNLFVFSYVS